MSWQTRASILLGAMVLLILAFTLPAIWTELVWLVRIVLFCAALFLVGVGIFRSLNERERYLTAKAQREREQYQARVIDTAHGTWFVARQDIDIVPLHDTPYLRINGHEREMTPDERYYTILHAPRTLQGTQQNVALPEPQLDLLTIFTQPTQSYAIIGGQQVGKTYQARRIASYWLSSGIQPLVIGPKWDTGEWSGCSRLYGGNYDFEAVQQGMKAVENEAKRRHSESIPHKQHPLLPVFFDDWTSIRAKLADEAESFILDATTLYASVNIILYFILHLDTANAWGVGRVGAALHQNFIKLFIEPGFNEQGLVDRGRNVGYLLMAGQSKKDRKQVRLFSGVALLPDLVIQPQDKESRIIEMIQSGASNNEIAQEIFGKATLSGDNFYKVKLLRDTYTTT